MRGAWTGFLLEDIIDEETGRVIIPRRRGVGPAEGSQFLDWGVHETDALRWLTGPRSPASTPSTTWDPTAGRPDSAGPVTMANGVMAQLLMTYEALDPGWCPTTDPDRRVEGIIEADHYGVVNLGDADGWRIADEQVAFNFLGDYLDPNRLEGFAAQVQDFAEAIQDDRDPVVTGQDGRAAVEIVEAADRSAATHQAVTLPLSG
jgi:predicted dehydrogenase